MTKLHFTAVPHAEESAAALRARYGDAGPDEADIVVALGGDGFMLQTLHSFTGKGKPIYGMNRGTVGFLMNEYHQDDLPERLAAAEKAVIHPLKMTAHTPLPRGRGPRLQRSLAAARNPPGRQDPHPGGRQAAHLRTDLRRRAGLDARRLHRL